MQQWEKCIVVLLAWKMAMVGAQCSSGFTCSGTPECYLIYPCEDGWKYTDPMGNIFYGDDNVYASPNCYKFIRVTEGIGSRNDAQRECEKVGGNITVINSNEEYEQLMENVLHLLSYRDDSTFNVQIQNLTQDGIDLSKGCGKITIEDGFFSFNEVDIINTDCSTTHVVDTIVCESMDVNTEICPVPATSMPTYTSVVSTHPSKKNQSEMEAGPNLWMVAVVASIVVITIIIILLSFVFIRRRHKRTKARYSPGPNQHLPSIGLPNEDGNQDRDVHQNTLYNAVGLDQDTAAEVVCQDITNGMENRDTAVEVEYHDTVVEVEYHDTAVEVEYQDTAVEVEYHDTAVEVEYHDTAVEVEYQDTAVEVEYHDIAVEVEYRDTAVEVDYHDTAVEVEYHDTAVEVEYHDIAVEVEYHDIAVEVDYHDTAVEVEYHDIAVEVDYHDTAVEVEYHDIAVEVDYHDTVVGVDYHDTVVGVDYHDTAVDVEYQNSGVGRTKRIFTKDQFELEEQKKELHMASGVGAHTSPLWSSEPSGHEDSDPDLNVTNSTDCVDDIPYENNINAHERLGNVKGTEFENEINEGYSEIDEFMLKEGGSTEADYLQIL